MSVTSGWYPDPQDPSRMRWWDGHRWGEVAPQQQGTASQPLWAAPAAPMSSTPTAPRPVFSVAPPAQSYAAVPATAWEDPLLSDRGRKGRAARDRAVRTANPFGYAGIVLSLLAFLINPLGILGVLGTVFGGVGLARAKALRGQRFTGFGFSLAAVILGAFRTYWAVRVIVHAVTGAPLF